MEAHRKEVMDIWLERLSTCPRLTPSIQEILQRELQQRQDLLSIWLQAVEPDEKAFASGLVYLVEKVRTKEYSISDLYSEIGALEGAFEFVLATCREFSSSEVASISETARCVLRELFGEILGQTSSVLELMIECGPIAYCQLNPEGRIVYTNPPMTRLLGKQPPTDMPFAELFLEHRDFVVGAISGNLGPEPPIRELQMMKDDKTPIVVRASIHPLSAAGRCLGAYACLSDVTSLRDRERRILEHSPLPSVIVESGSRRLIYANPAALSLLGVPTVDGLTLYDIFRDPRSKDEIDRQLCLRDAGEGGVYDIELTRPSDGKSILVSILGIPIMDEQGSTVGSIGVVRPIELERASLAIHALVEKEQDATHLLMALAEEIRRVVPFDLFVVSEYSRNINHSAALLVYPSDVIGPLKARWQPLAAPLRSWLSSVGATLVNDLVAFLKKEESRELSQSPDVAHLLEVGFKSLLRIPVTRGKHMVASVSLMSKTADQYSKGDLDRLQMLPVEAAVHMALHYRDLVVSRFRYELIKKLSNCSTPEEIAELIVVALSEQFGWEHVSVFRVDVNDKLFTLVAQRPATLPENYQQSLAEGVLGCTYQAKAVQKLDDVRKVERHIKTVMPNVRSEMCLPLICDTEVRWLLNVEDRMANAFSEDEVVNVKEILDEVTLVLKRVCWQHLLQSAVSEAADAVILTDSQENILYANPATARLLGYEAGEKIHGAFRALVADEGTANALLNAKRTASRKVELVSKGGAKVEVMLSGGKLPVDVPGKVFIAKDLTGQVLFNVKDAQSWLKDIYKNT